MPRLSHIGTAVLLSLGLQVAHATPSLLQSGNFAYSCSGRGNGNGYNGINLQDGFVAGQFKCKESSVAPALASKAASHYSGVSGGSSKGKAKSLAGKGAVLASSSTLSDEGNRSLTGFADHWTISVPGVDTRAALLLTVRLKVQGQLEAHGLSGSAGLGAAVFADGAHVGGRQWSIRSEIAAPDVFLAVNDTASVSLLINNDAPFWLAATLTASSGVAAMGAPGSGRASTPASGLLWDGVVELRDYWSGQVYTNWTLSTDSGVDWRLPCPCTVP
ncbi:hypothetical protein KAK07_15990 [Ideonella sp. 4Y16]|uniref:Uncharacterized protein n=1 Tax=Ideonella alba TaxID=2824118 RepID=A0A940Y6H1_9BURK|nr:hypothetical protein [Ideonella alba]MBQ0930727.1 hypothetical protein [Ideonella alba]MBQ0944842.1 hypothetical protein [Ideonella alba]